MGVVAGMIRGDGLEPLRTGPVADSEATTSSVSDGHSPPELEMMLALERTHRTEIAKLNALLVRYRALLEEHGIEPPDSNGRDELAHFRACRRAAELAYAILDTPELRERLGEIRTIT